MAGNDAGCSSLPNSLNQSANATQSTEFRCHIPGCRALFLTTIHFLNHRNYHIGVDHFICPVLGCGRCYILESSLKLHIKRFHDGVILTEKLYPVQEPHFCCNINIATHFKPINCKGLYICAYRRCRCVFPSRLSLQRHSELHQMKSQSVAKLAQEWNEVNLPPIPMDKEVVILAPPSSVLVVKTWQTMQINLLQNGQTST